MSQELPFDPFPFLDDPHKQTIINTMVYFTLEPTSEKRLVSLPDGDKISLEITTPPEWKPDQLTVFLVHGLCGSHQSPNLVRMVKRLAPLGIRTVRFNMRGCGSGKGHARQMYHSGRSEDVFECLNVLKKEHPDSPILLIGFSLGGNIVLKLAGELGSVGHHFLSGVIGICPPVELHASSRMLGEEANAMYEKYFYRILRADVHYRQKRFKDIEPINLPRNLKLYEFDQLFVAPRNGFESAIDYYNKCSASHVVGDISIPCRILLSEDDPIIAHNSLDHYHLPSNVEVYKTKKGGHMGYLGTSDAHKGFYWLDSLLTTWVHDF